MMETDERSGSGEERVAILHIGQPKTGSTTIGYALDGYDDGSAFAASRSLGVSAALIAAFSDDPLKFHMYRFRRGRSGAEYIRRKKAECLAALSAMLNRRDRSRIVLSSESVWNLENAGKAKLVAFIRSHGWQVRVVAYVREPASWATAIISQYLKTARKFPSKLDPGYKRGLETFAGLLPPEDLHVRLFDRDRLAGGDVVADFRRAVGLDLSRIDAPDRRTNESLPLPAIKLLFRFVRLGIPAQYDPELYKAYKRLMRVILEKYAGMGKLDPALCEGVADHSETDWLYETFGIDFRRKTPPERPRADLEAVLNDLSDVDLSGLDDLLAGYGVRCENFTAVEQKLHRLFYAILTERAVLGQGYRLLLISLAWRLGRDLLKPLFRSRLFSPARRKALKQAVTGLRDR